SHGARPRQDDEQGRAAAGSIRVDRQDAGAVGRGGEGKGSAMNKLTSILYLILTAPFLPIGIGMALYQDRLTETGKPVLERVYECVVAWVDDVLTIGGWREGKD